MPDINEYKAQQQERTRIVLTGPSGTDDLDRIRDVMKRFDGWTVTVESDPTPRRQDQAVTTGRARQDKTPEGRAETHVRAEERAPGVQTVTHEPAQGAAEGQAYTGKSRGDAKR